MFLFPELTLIYTIWRNKVSVEPVLNFHELILGFIMQYTNFSILLVPFKIPLSLYTLLNLNFHTILIIK